ncbi:hypothetical protein [Nonomuraea insulae]|uniref:Uncharacterized protein n=1 Tax=Nonomuraea insulae TaxID=1616787 RepID=A0ABW1D909_9ACTN
MADSQAEPGRRCASPFCRNRLPADATTRRRYCSGACRQAAWRIDNPFATPAPAPPDPHELAVLEEKVRRRAAHLAVHAKHIADPLTGTGKQTVALRTLPDLVEGLLAAHVAARRAAGDTWEQVGQTLTMHPDTARRRFGRQSDDDPGDSQDQGGGEDNGNDDGPADDAEQTAPTAPTALTAPSQANEPVDDVARPWTSEADPLSRPLWYTDAELDAVQVVKSDIQDDVPIYWVIIAGELLGTVTRRLGGHGWRAYHRNGTLATHTGPGKHPATMAAAVLDLVADVHRTWQNRRASRAAPLSGWPTVAKRNDPFGRATCCR